MILAAMISVITALKLIVTFLLLLVGIGAFVMGDRADKNKADPLWILMFWPIVIICILVDVIVWIL